MALGRLGTGERAAGVSAVLLLFLMFIHWFGVKAVNTSNLLFATEAGGPGKNAWDALDYIPTVLLITILAALAVAWLRVTNALREDAVPVNVVVALLGFVSALLILYRVLDPPVFLVERTVTYEGAVRFPIFLALAAACGIAYGGYRAAREEGVSVAALARRLGMTSG